MGTSIIRSIYIFTVIMFLQIVILSNVSLGGLVTPYLYIILIMLLPSETGRSTLLIYSFFLGLIVDVFAGSYGIHSASALVVAFVRPYLLRVIYTKDDLSKFGGSTIDKQDFLWFSKYSLVLSLFYNTTFYMLEALSFSNILRTLYSIVLGTIASVLVIYVAYMFLKQSKKVSR